MTTHLIRYDLLVQDAMLGVVRRVLADAAREGLPGEHHFYITFKTRHPGVKISKELLARFDDEITIVLQHQFWDLVVGEHGFEVGLAFGQAPEKLEVAYEAISGFYDPSVQFGLKFEVLTQDDAEDEIESEPVVATPKARKSGPKLAEASAQDEPAAAVNPETAADETKNVVSLDTFRKKK